MWANHQMISTRIQYGLSFFNYSIFRHGSYIIHWSWQLHTSYILSGDSHGHGVLVLWRLSFIDYARMLFAYLSCTVNTFYWYLRLLKNVTEYIWQMENKSPIKSNDVVTWYFRTSKVCGVANILCDNVSFLLLLWIWTRSSSILNVSFDINWFPELSPSPIN